MKTTFKGVGSILGMCGLFFAPGEIAIAGVQDIRVLNRNDNGSFLAICRNGDTETTSAYEIRKDLVCEGDVDRNDPDNAETASVFTCTGDEFFDRFYITRIENNERLGDHLPLQKCRRLIEAASDELICTGNNFFDRFYMTRISNGERLGRHTRLSTCFQLIEDTAQS